MNSAWRVFDRVVQVIAVALAASLTIAAWHDVSQAYDVWYYHVPFAGRLAGLFDASSYVFSADNLARFEGFPLFGELLQGLAWRMTGHVAATNLVSIAALFGLVAFLWRVFAVPLHLALVALLAIPLVMTHSTSSYVDLPANACTAMVLLAVLDAAISEAPPSRRFLIGSGLLAAAAANTKFQLVPMVTIAFGALVAVLVARWGRRMLVLAAFFPLVFATPLKNVALHGNPVWPVALTIAGRTLPYVEEAYGSSPAHLEGASRPVRFLRSALEVDNRPLASHARWSVDQWTPPDEPAYRMGGYFGAYVVVNLVALALALGRMKERRTQLVTGALFGVATTVAALVPQSHELRYYMFWMLLLVALNLIFWARRLPVLSGVVALGALAIVAWSTNASYLYASGGTFAELVSSRVDRGVVARAGAKLCVAQEPFTVLYASLFHAPKHYVLQEARTEADCR